MGGEVELLEKWWRRRPPLRAVNGPLTSAPQRLGLNSWGGGIYRALRSPPFPFGQRQEKRKGLLAYYFARFHLPFSSVSPSSEISPGDLLL